MKNKKKVRNKFRTPSQAEESIEVLNMPVPSEKKEVAPIESTKTQVQNELNNNELNLVLEESNISVNVVEEPNENVVKQDSNPISVNVVEEPNENVVKQDSNPIPVVFEAEVIKHPLEHTWGLWLFTNENKKNWTDNMKQLSYFKTVEDFWCLYHHTKLPSELQNGQDYAIFKQGISPMWEDPTNKPGGRWFINMEQKTREMDRVWLDLVLLMIGESLVNSDIICGAVVNVRTKKPNKVSLWTRNKDEKAVLSIGRQLKQTLQLHFRIQFLDHKNNTHHIV